MVIQLIYFRPYDNRWSKTMIGYGAEDDNFVLELTYNYPVKSYKLGNDFVGITIQSKEALERAKSVGWPILPGNVLEAPGGFKFIIIEKPQPQNSGTFLLNKTRSSTMSFILYNLLYSVHRVR